MSLGGLGIRRGASNHTNRYKYFTVAPDINGTTNYLAWQDVGVTPGVWRYSPKQHDFHSINIEDIAYRSANEMVLGLRAPLTNRTTGKAYYFVVTNVTQFLATSPWPTGGTLQGIAGPYEMNLNGLGIRSIKWCPQLGPGGAGRYLVLAGSANGGPLVREGPKQKFSLYSWTGNTATAPSLLIDNLQVYAIRPEGVDLISVSGEWRVLFVEDRFQSIGYARRNAVHWPLSILGTVN